MTAGFAEARRIQTRAIIEAHQAGGDEARFRADLLNVIVGGDEASARLRDFYSQLACANERQERGEVNREIALREDHFVMGLEVETHRDSGEAGAGARSKSDFIGLGVHYFRQRRAHAFRQAEISLLGNEMRKL